ncbi:MAG: hypothetical protein IJX96_04140 [Clostridia bacterium]|nr:hypothetical protein [Clostridia bacterium]
MLCGNCRKNQATKTYEQIKKGKKTIEYYCLDCYHRLFIVAENEEGTDGENASVCPYCGTAAEELKKRNLVGCARCYKTFATALAPVIVKMQGGAAHRGKRPVGGETERLTRRLNELKTIVEKRNAEGDFETARAYTERLLRLQENIEEEEDFVWRKRPLSYKRS